MAADNGKQTKGSLGWSLTAKLHVEEHGMLWHYETMSNSWPQVKIMHMHIHPRR